MNTKRAVLIVPEFPFDSFWSYRYILRWIGRKAAFPPLGMITFAAYLPRDWQLELIDLNTTTPSDATLREQLRAADVAFVSAMSIQKRSLLHVLSLADGLDTPIVLGGPFASSYRDQIRDPHCESDQRLHDGLDAVVWGEAQTSIDELLAYLATNPRHSRAQPRLFIPAQVAHAASTDNTYLNDRNVFKPLYDVPAPRWDLLRVKDYHSMMIQTTAGCPFRCDFCDIIRFNGGFSRPKQPRQVRRELEAILRTGYRGSIFSVDDNFVGSPAAIEAVLDEMIEFQREHDYPFSFFTQASVNLGTPALGHLVGKMKAAAFDAVFLGIENPSPEALRAMNKKQNLKVDIAEVVASLQRAGIEVYGGFIFGSDEDTPAAADQIVEFVTRNRIFSAMTGMLTPVPHTPLHDRLRLEGRLKIDEFTGNNTDDNVQFEPRLMSGDQLRDGIDSILTRLFSARATYGRAIAMLRAVQPQIFNRGKMQVRYARAAVMSLLRQGVLKLDFRYFKLLWQAAWLDHARKRAARRELRAIQASARAVRTLSPEACVRPPAAMNEWLTLARDYVVRFRSDMNVAKFDEWAAGIQEQIRKGTLQCEQVRTVCAQAVQCLKVRVRQHRFPGLTVSRAFEVALKAFHYQRVAASVLARETRRAR
ncbi:MAG TPA: radical SAM protein [Longimicrobiales bacterium]